MINGKEYKISPDAIKIGQAMTLGILMEASCNPSPGLVSPFSMGAHEDMNFLSFMLGSSVISPYFSLFGQMGMNWDEKTSLLNELRVVGKCAEKQLLQKTGGVNTQRGILFLGGIVAAASGAIVKSEKITIDKICNKVSQICEGLVEKELQNLKFKKEYTDGEKIFIEHGITGIRGEVNDGLPSIFNISYPNFVKAMESGVGLNYAMVDSLLHLIAEVEDTTIISRVGIMGLKKAQARTREVIEKGSVYTIRGKREICKLNRYFINENISPGGCADLLAITISIYILEEREIGLKHILKGYGDFKGYEYEINEWCNLSKEELNTN